MNSKNNVNSLCLHDVLVRKLHPNRFVRLPGTMAAVMGFILEATFIEPPIVEIKVDDGIVFARAQGEFGERRIGTYADHLHNWLLIVRGVGLTCHELLEAQALFALRGGFLSEVSTA